MPVWMNGICSLRILQNEEPDTMLFFLFKTIASLFLGLIIGVAAASDGASGGIILAMMVWCLGMSFAIRSHLAWLSHIMHSAMQLSIISFLSFGTGFLGFLLLFLVVVFNLSLGWIYGIFLFFRDLIALCKGKI